MNGRVYDPVIGRFLSVDIFVPYPFKTQSFNRYSYVRNNPLKFIDPSGYVDEDGMDESDETDGYGNEFGSEAYGGERQGDLSSGGSGTNQSGGFDNDGTDGDGYGDDVEGGANSYNENRAQRAREREKAYTKVLSEAKKAQERNVGELVLDAAKEVYNYFEFDSLKTFLGTLSMFFEVEAIISAENKGKEASKRAAGALDTYGTWKTTGVIFDTLGKMLGKSPHPASKMAGQFISSSLAGSLADDKTGELYDNWAETIENCVDCSL